MAPIAASSEAMSKLRGFQYEPHQDTSVSGINKIWIDESEKENVQICQDNQTTIAVQTTPRLRSFSQNSLSKDLRVCSPPSQKNVEKESGGYLELSQRSVEKGAKEPSQRSGSKTVRECPQTPIGRLPLAELIASGEDFNNHGLDKTPIERVLWDHSQRSMFSNNSRRTATMRKRKQRANSSSSPQTENPIQSGTRKPSFDLQNLQTSLRTPQADPANDLWSRYSLNTNLEKLSSTRFVGPALDSFLHPSSPETAAKHLPSKEVGRLRRSYSCGIEWPTSGPKRRKIQYNSSNHETDVGFAVPGNGHDRADNSKMARVSILLEELQERFAKSDTSEDEDTTCPSSSLPFSRKSNSLIHDPSSPIRYSQTRARNTLCVQSQPETGRLCPNMDQRSVEVSVLKVANAKQEHSEVISDFDDDELDLQMLKAMGEAAETRISLASPIDIPQHISKEDINWHKSKSNEDFESLSFKSAGLNSKQSSTASEQLDQSSLHLQGSASSSQRDEFDDGNCEMLETDLENVLAMYDTDLQPRTQSIINLPCQTEKLDVTQPKIPNGNDVALGVNTGVESDDDEFGGDSDFETVVAQCEEATQRPQIASQLQSSNDREVPLIKRYLIMTIAEESSNNGKEQSQTEKVLLVQDEKTKLKKAIVLRGAWLDSPCTPGSYVNLVGDFDKYGQCIVDNWQNLLIIHPDHLISATVVADSFSCTRRAVLQDRVKATSQLNESTVYGSMLHEIFQEALRFNRWDTECLTVMIKQTAIRYLESLFEINVEIGKAIDHLLSKAVELQAWARVFVAARPKANAIIKDRNGAQALMSVNKLLDVEEKLWSPTYGLKGMVDATVQVSMSDNSRERTLTVPFEIKTGKFSNAAHRAQTALYTLLLSDRYDIEVVYGILYYTETSEISRIPAVRHELIHMVMQRNELACYVRKRLYLPPMLKSAHLCGKCYAQKPCFIYHKLVEDGTGETSGMGETFDDLVKHLNPSHQVFFRKWDDLITKEEKDSLKFRRELWTMQSTEREKLGRCFGRVIIDPQSAKEQVDAPKINRFHYGFVKQTATPNFSFTDSQIAVGEPIVISDERGHFALASGYVTKMQKHKIHVSVDRRLSNARTRTQDFDARKNQSFRGIMEIIEDGHEHTIHIPTQSEELVLYRIDKDEFSNGMATVRNNLIRLMEKDVFNAQALRKLIVEGVAPIFKPSSTPYSSISSASHANLNVDQRCAIEKVMSARDYALVLGMPGTGKTTTIAHIIRALAAQGKSVLLTSYTHTAVDNILLKIRKDNIGVFRVGAVAKIHPEIQEFADLAGVPMKTVEEIEKSYSRQVVATTCLGINHPIFNQRVFDYCIVDEASQITLPVCLGPIRMARTFILVGDHNQLPPLVQNKEALEGGLDISLFRMLSEKHPSSVVNLEHQYRMCHEIMTLSNTLIYGGRLKCGTPEIANRTLTIPFLDALAQHHPTFKHSVSIPSKSVCMNPEKGSCWIRDLLDPSVKVCLVNTDRLIPASRETQSGSRIVNHCEATLCTQLVESLVTTGISSSDIGVITLYRSQLALIKQNLRHQHPAVEMHTADKFQGRDKEVVVLSLVRSNKNQHVGDLLKDWRRINVMFTRAKTKLLVIGSAETIKGNELLKKFVALMKEKDWMYDLPKEAMERHVWDEAELQSHPRRESHLTQEETNSIQRQKMGGTNRLRAVGDSEGKENPKSEQTKSPPKARRLNPGAFIGRRPILRDIANEAS